MDAHDSSGAMDAALFPLPGETLPAPGTLEAAPPAPGLPPVPEEPETPETPEEFAEEAPPEAPPLDAGAEEEEPEEPFDPSELSFEDFALWLLASGEPSAALFRQEEFLNQFLWLRLDRWWRWWIRPEERERLAKEYPDLCPAGEDSIDWYMVQRARRRLKWRRWLAHSPALALGPGVNLLTEWALGRASVVLTLLAAFGFYSALYIGEFFASLARARSTGLLQGLLMAGRSPRGVSRRILWRAKHSTAPFPALMIAGGIADAYWRGQGSMLEVVFAATLLIWGAASLLRPRADSLDAVETDASARGFEQALLSVGMLIGGAAAHLPKPALGLVFWMGPVVALILVGGMCMLAGGAIAASSQGAKVWLLGGFLLLSFVAFEAVSSTVKRLAVDRDFDAEIGEHP